MQALKNLTAALGAATIIASLLGSAVYASSGDPSQWGLTSTVASASKVNEYEGQHRAALASGGSKNGDVPVVSG